jgi:hypothetical protein
MLKRLALETPFEQLDASDEENRELAARFYQAKLQLDLHKQELCLAKLQDIMDTVYSDIKNTPLYRKILENLKEVSKKFLTATKTSLTQEKVDDFNSCVEELYSNVTKLEKNKIAESVAEDIKISFARCFGYAKSAVRDVNQNSSAETSRANQVSCQPDLAKNVGKETQSTLTSDVNGKNRISNSTNSSVLYGSNSPCNKFQEAKPYNPSPTASALPTIWDLENNSDPKAHGNSIEIPSIEYYMSPEAKYNPQYCTKSNTALLKTQKTLHLQPGQIEKIDLNVRWLQPHQEARVSLNVAKYSPVCVHYNILIVPDLITVGTTTLLQIAVQSVTTEAVTVPAGTTVCELYATRSEPVATSSNSSEISHDVTEDDSDEKDGDNETLVHARERIPFDPVPVHYGAAHVQSLVDQIDPHSVNIGLTTVSLLGTSNDRIDQVNDLLEFESSLLTGSSMGIAALLPLVHEGAVRLHQSVTLAEEEEKEEIRPDPDNFRLPDGSFPELTRSETAALLAADLADNYKLTVDTLIDLQNGESRLRKIKEDIVGGQNPHQYFLIKNGVLCREYSVTKDTTQYLGIYVPTSILYSVIIYIHKHFLHPSKTQTYREFCALYYHPFARRAVRKVCEACVVCAQARNAENKGNSVGRERTLKPSKPRESVSMDVLYFPQSAKGYKYGLIVSDLYSLYISFYPLRTKNSTEVAKQLGAYIAAHGPPVTVYSDNDPSFRGEVERLLRVHGIKHHTSYPFTQRQNYVESQIRIFKNAYRAAIVDSPVFKTKDWDSLYPLVVCRINSMISKYGMSREAVHYGQVVESSLPLITDTSVFGTLEEDLEKASNLFRERMGRFMQRKLRNKTHYKIGKKYNFYMNELVMYKVYTPASMLHPTFAGPARIIELSEKGATLRDTKYGTLFSATFENLRKVNFDELLTLLPQNFDSEIAETIQKYRYRRAPGTALDPDPQQADPNLYGTTIPDGLEPEPLEEPEPEPEHIEPLVAGDIFSAPPPPDSPKQTRSGRLYNVQVQHLPPKYASDVKKCIVKPGCIPQIVPPLDMLPALPCLKRRPLADRLYKLIRPFKRAAASLNTSKTKLLDPADSIRVDGSQRSLRKKSSFNSDDRCTQELILEGNKPPGRIKFGKVTVFYF